MQLAHLLSALWRNRTGPLLIAVQIAIALTVLVNVASIVIVRFDTYFRPTGIDLPNIFWVSSQGIGADYHHEAVVKADLAYLNSLPAVVAAAASMSLPQTYSGFVLPFSASAGDKAPKEAGAIMLMSSGGLDALGVTLIAGRAPSAQAVSPASAGAVDALARWAPEVAITRALATKVFPKGDALGQTLYAGLINKSSKVVGIVDLMETAPVMGPWSSFAQQVVFVPAIPPGPMALYLIRTKPGRRAEVMAQVEKKLGDSEPTRFIERMETLEKTAFNTRNWIRSSSIILGFVALLVLGVTAVGIFGLAAFTVTTRTKQIGTRRAIGARRAQILKYFLLENWLITTAGVAVGCLLALAVGLQLTRMFQTPRLPLYDLVGGIVFLWALGLCAVLFPARRAAAISPAIATRTV